MTKQTTPTSSYKEVRIGKTIYRVTSFFSGEKDLGKTLEQLAVRREYYPPWEPPVSRFRATRKFLP